MYQIITSSGQTFEDFFGEVPMLFRTQLKNKLILLKDYAVKEELIGWLIYEYHDEYYFTLEDIDVNIFIKIFVKFNTEKHTIIILRIERGICI